MRSYTTYDWMLASGLALKGLPLSLFAMTASYNRKGRRLYESRESLAGYLGYSERQVGKALQSLVSTELLVLRLTDGQLPHAHYTRWYSNQGGSRKEGQGQECVGRVERVK